MKNNVRINIILPAELVDEIDRVAGAAGGRRRSAFLTEAAREKLARLRFDEAAARAFGAWKDENHPDLITDADMERYLERAREATNRRLQQQLDDE